MAKKIIKLTETELNRIIQKVITEQTNLGIKNPGAPKFMPDISSKANTSAGFKSSTPAPKSNYTNTGGILRTDVGKGDASQEVKNVQNYLIQLGYSVGYGKKLVADGKFGPITQNALMNFQQSNNLKPTGRADAATLSALKSKVKVNQLANPIKTPPPSKTFGVNKSDANPPKPAVAPVKPATAKPQAYGGGGGWLGKKLRQG